MIGPGITTRSFSSSDRDLTAMTTGLDGIGPQKFPIFHNYQMKSQANGAVTFGRPTVHLVPHKVYACWLSRLVGILVIDEAYADFAVRITPQF